MARKPLTVAQLAAEADMELDEVLVTLWDAGIEEVNDPSDRVPSRKAPLARRTLMLPTTRELRSISFLANVAGMPVAEAQRQLLEAGVISSTGSDRIPKGRVKKSRKVLGLSGAQLVASLQSTDEEEQLEPQGPEFKWSTVGNEEDFRPLTAEEVERIHFGLVEDFARSGDPIEPPGVRDRNLLESAAFRPHTSLGGVRKYPTVPLAAGALFHSLTLNHAFHNGNKRTAVVSLLVFLDRNKYVLEVSEVELFKYVLFVAQHRVIRRSSSFDRADREAHEIARWVCDNMRKVKKDELPVRWGDLKRILSDNDCSFQSVTGNRMNIQRTIPRQRRFGSSRKLRTQVFYADDGREAEPNTIHKIRKDLQLDDEHGVDSDVFYRGRPVIDTFIAKYRKTLIRLARL